MINGFLNCLENKMVLSIYHYLIGFLYQEKGREEYHSLSSQRI